MKKTAVIPCTILFAAAMLTGAACHTPPEMRHFDNDAGKRVPGAIAVMPVVVALDNTPLEEDNFGRDVLRTLDAAAVREELASELRHARIFDRVISVSGKIETDAEYVLYLKIRRASVRFDSWDGRDMKIILWILAWFPNWYYAAEVYAMSFTVEAELERRGPEVPLFRKKIRYTYRQHLDDFERGWMYAGLLRVPDALGDENWDLIEKSILPYAVNGLVVRIVESIAKTDLNKK
jgi:hypothetical protein